MKKRRSTYVYRNICAMMLMALIMGKPTMLTVGAESSIAGEETDSAEVSSSEELYAEDNANEETNNEETGNEEANNQEVAGGEINIGDVNSGDDCTQNADGANGEINEEQLADRKDESGMEKENAEISADTDTDLTEENETSSAEDDEFVSEEDVQMFLMAENVPEDGTLAVKIEWGDMKFEYQRSITYLWNPKTHQYDKQGAVSEGWNLEKVDGNNNAVAITNQSNQPLMATVTITMEEHQGNRHLLGAVCTTNDEAQRWAQMTEEEAAKEREKKLQEENAKFSENKVMLSIPAAVSPEATQESLSASAYVTLYGKLDQMEGNMQEGDKENLEEIKVGTLNVSIQAVEITQ